MRVMGTLPDFHDISNMTEGDKDVMIDNINCFAQNWSMLLQISFNTSVKSVVRDYIYFKIILKNNN